MGKKLFWALMVVCLGIGVIVTIPDPELEKPQQRYDEALARAKLENKPVLIDFYTSWCPPCKLFDKVRQSDAQLIQELESVILVQIDCERGTGVDLAKAYEVDRYPTFVLLTPQGDVQHLWLGFEKHQFIKDLREGLGEMKL